MEYEYRLQFLVDYADLFFERGIQIGHHLTNPTQRVLHHDTAVDELQNSANGRLRTPVIVYERIDSAVIRNDARMRDLIAHDDVKFWLKRNTYRDFELNNRHFLTGRLHYMMLNEYPKFRIGPTIGEEVSREITADMAAKIRLLPVAPLDRFSAYREAVMNWSEKRAIDINFAGLVDYEVRGTDFWDAEFDRAQAATSSDFASIVNRHRREAVRQLIEMRHLRIFIGMNRAVSPDLYIKAMLRSSIAVSPWGFGEYAYRDYEAILAGAILVKPYSDHIMTFAPGIFQANKFYVPCSADFSDLHDVIRSIMINRDRSIDIARAARESLLHENAPVRVVEYFADLFYRAVGRSYKDEAVPAIPSPRGWSKAALSLFGDTPGVARGTLEKVPGPADGVDVDVSYIFTEDNTPENSHDFRLSRSDLILPGVYRIRCLVRALERKFIAIQIHQNWLDGATFHVDLESGDISEHRARGTGFAWIEKPRVRFGVGGWRAISAFVRIERVITRDFFIVLNAANDGSSYNYSGDGRQAFEVVAFDVDRVSEFGEGSGAQ